MRFRRLAIPAYGPFTALELDFSGGERGGAADFHLIHGRNEAGKSSLLRAIRDLLYGIHAQTADNFLHEYKDLRIGAEIENQAGRRLAVQRRKGNRNTLLDAAGQPLADDALAPFLGPVDREFFTTMFGLGAEELRQGAHDLLQGKGDLGQALFSASLAGTPIHRVLDGLDGEARTLFNGRAKTGVSLRPAVEVYEAATRDSRQAQVKPETWEAVLRELEHAQRAKTELDAELHARRGRQDWLRRCLDALPTLGRLHETEARLHALPAAPALPDGFVATAEAARERLARAEQGLSELRRRVEALGARRDTLSPRADVLARAAEIDALVAGLAIYRQGREAVAVDTAEASQMQARLRTGLLDLGLSIELAGIAELRLSLGEQQDLRDAAAALRESELAAEAQRRECERVAVEIGRTEQQQARLPGDDVAALREAQTATANAAALAQGLPGREAALEGLSRRLASQLRLLPGASEDTEAAYALPLPAAARLREFEAAAADLATRTRQLDEARQATAKRRRELKAKLEQLEKRGVLPSSGDLDRAREQRELGWRQVLACWMDGVREPEWDGAPLSESYPAAVRHADTLADRLREEADAVAQAEDLRGQLLEIDAIDQDQRDESTRLQQAARSWQDDWNALWRPVGLPPASPAEMLEWREQWLEFRTRHEAWRESRDEVRAAREAIAAAEQRLRPLLEMAPASLLELRALAETRLREADQARGARRSLSQRLDELRVESETLARRQVEIDSALTEARARWRAHRLGGDNRPENALDLLAARLELVARYDDWNRLGDVLAERIRGQEEYESRVRALIEALGRSDSLRAGNVAGAAAIGAEVQVNTLREALAQARALRERRAQVEEDLEQLLASQPHAEQEAEAARRLMAALLAQAGVADSSALQGLLAELAERQRLLEARDGLHAALHVPARGEALERFIERVRGEDGEALATELDDLADQLRELEARREQAIQALARAEDAKARLEASGANAAEYLQTARHAAARIRQDAARYLRLRLATRFLRDQIEAFRQRNQDPLLARAGELFRQMTGTSFSGLGTDYAQDDTPILVGLKDGVAVPVAGMSEGTRDQLFLALRLAALEQHGTRHEAMPLILDDLLITFDDDRSRAILTLLGKLAGNTQIFLFTHHRHLLDLARDTLPADAWHLHELDELKEAARGETA